VHAIPIPEGAVPPDATVPAIAAVLDVLPTVNRQEASSVTPNRRG
jgi:hypothetical protein